MNVIVNSSGFRVECAAGDAGRWAASIFMRHLVYLVIAVVAGCGLTLVSYVVGDPLVRPALYLARLFAEDRGGESLLGPFLAVNTALCAALIYAALCLVGRAVKTAGN